MLATLTVSLLGTDIDYSRGQEQRDDNSVKVCHGDMAVLTEEWDLWTEGSLCPVGSNLGRKNSVLNQGQQTRYASCPGAEIHRCETGKQKVGSV